MTTKEWIALIASTVLLALLLIQYRRWESKRLKQRTYDAMSPGLRSEIDEERRVNLKKRQKFMEALDKADDKADGVKAGKVEKGKND